MNLTAVQVITMVDPSAISLFVNHPVKYCVTCLQITREKKMLI